MQKTGTAQLNRGLYSRTVLNRGAGQHRSAYILDLEPAVQYRPTSADVDRSRIPEATAFKPAAFPETHVTTLPNGLKMRHAQWQGGPLVVASLIVRGSASVDPNDKQGVARLTASLLTAGAGSMSEDDLADALGADQGSARPPRHRSGRAGQMLLIRTQVQSQRTAQAIAAIKGHLESVKGSKPISPTNCSLPRTC